MDPRDHLRIFVAQCGGSAADEAGRRRAISSAAARLGIPVQTLRGVLNGWRGVSRKQAIAWASASSGALDAERLVWIRPTKFPPAKDEAA